jgi:cardiolipin synthase
VSPLLLSASGWATVAAIVGALLVIADLAIRLAALGVIPENRRPSSGMAWLLLTLLVPFLGLALFLLFGQTRVGRKRSAKQRAVNATIAARTADITDDGAAPDAPYLQTIVALNRRLGALPLLHDNNVEVISDYRGSIEAMTEAVHAAEEYVHVEFYIMAWDQMTGPFFEALQAAVERGVAVRLLFDHLGTRGIPGYDGLLKRLALSGIDWHLMLPIQPLKGRFRRPDLRNHRKLLVVDGGVGFTGSLNLTEPGYNKPKNHQLGREWVELMLRLEGPAVAALDATFATDWLAETDQTLDARPQPAPPATGAALAGVACQIVPSGPGFVTENNLRMFTSLIYAAVHRISLTSPYFVPDESLLYAVTTAAQRGVATELFVSEQADQFMVGHAQASYYRALLDAGVRIHLYPAPYVLHSKHFTIDDQVAVVGSSNMDMRSFALNYELSTMLIGPEVVARIREVEDTYRALSHELTLAEWEGRPARKRYVDNVMRLTAALQ